MRYSILFLMLGVMACAGMNTFVMARPSAKSFVSEAERQKANIYYDDAILQCTRNTFSGKDTSRFTLTDSKIRRLANCMQKKGINIDENFFNSHDAGIVTADMFKSPSLYMDYNPSFAFQPPERKRVRVKRQSTAPSTDLNQRRQTKIIETKREEEGNDSPSVSRPARGSIVGGGKPVYIPRMK